MTEQELDRMLDAALESYVAEPPAELTPRVLARVRRPPVRWMAWGAAAALVFVTLAVVGRRSGDPAPVSRPRPVMAQAVAPAPTPMAAKPAPMRRLAPRPASDRPRLTNEEQQLVSLVTHHPELVAQALTPAAPEPVTIAPIQIEPLTNPQ